MNAINGVVEDCMQAKGYDFDYPIATVRTVFGQSAPMKPEDIWTWGSSRDTDRGVEEGYGLGTSVDIRNADIQAALEAAELGRSLVPDLASFSAAELETFNVDLTGGDAALVEVVLPTGDTEAMYGGGCLGDGVSAMYGDVRDYLRISGARSAATDEVWVTVLADSRVVAALGEWQGCMTLAGFEFEDPPALLSEVASHVAAGDLVYETDVAAADNECRAGSGLSESFVDSFEAAAGSVLPELEGLLLAASEFEGEAVVRAQSVVAPDNG